MKTKIGRILTSFIVFALFFVVISETNKVSAEEIDDLKESLDVFSEGELSEEVKEEIAILINKDLNEAELQSQESLKVANPELLLNGDLYTPQALDITSYTVAKKYIDNLKTANTVKNSYNRLLASEGTIAANTYRLGVFYNLVKTGGPWDLKQTLGKNTLYRFKGVNKTGEYIGNHHYGYMGRAIGFSTTVLKSAAGMYQIKSGTSDWKFIASYFDDPADQTAITHGVNDYNNGYRFSITVAQY